MWFFCNEILLMIYPQCKSGLVRGGQKWGPFYSTMNGLRVISKKRKKEFQLSTFSLYWINLKTITLRSLPERAILFRQSGEGGMFCLLWQMKNIITAKPLLPLEYLFWVIWFSFTAKIHGTGPSGCFFHMILSEIVVPMRGFHNYG